MVPRGLRGETPRYRWLEVPGSEASRIVIGFPIAVNRSGLGLRRGSTSTHGIAVREVSCVKNTRAGQGETGA